MIKQLSIACALAVMSFLTPLSPALCNSSLTVEEAEKLAEEAYIFAYPMLQTYKTLYTRAVVQKKPFNRFTHRHKLLDPSFKMVVGPNNDTLYSAAWFDLRTEPMVITVPDIPESRYYSIQFIDLYTQNFAYIGQRTTGPKGGSYLLVGPDDMAAMTPAGINDTFRAESNLVFAIVRILAKGKKDQELVASIQKQIIAQPLSLFTGAESPAPADPLVFPEYSIEAIKGARSIDLMNHLLQYAAIHPTETSMLERFGEIGIGAKAVRTFDSLEDPIKDAVNRGMLSAFEKINSATKNIGVKMAGWNTAFKGFGPREVMQGKYILRSAAAMLALYGNNKEENSSFTRQIDATGAQLDGSQGKYRLTFKADDMPPANAFWSLTMYQLPGVLLYENSIRRYSIGDRTKGLICGKDGSLTLYLQHEKPEDDHQLANWLPAPSGEFVVALRLYLPEEKVHSGKWHPPQLEHTATSMP